ncbi:hypothetical protein [Rubritalea profundi]|uniref:Uncharacterized protein n=1 Tax=Rubritalea profundi TaxID=1658618 RepID=A0A2S7U316_9BACT|nr:hypothetical protein [Rubritalea profundi]PQJ29379.1 hypothetical protein BSZ32_13385 [Rubritalea profundi]
MWIDAIRLKGATDTKLAVKGLLDEYAAVLGGPVEIEFLGGAASKGERPKARPLKNKTRIAGKQCGF